VERLTTGQVAQELIDLNLGEHVTMTRILKQALIVSSLFLTVSCADLKRMQGNMDQMVQYMGVMASCMPHMVNSTARMATTAERMQGKTDALLANLEKKGGGAERAIQNYSQAVLDNERAVIKTLQGIRQELGDLKQSLRPAAAGSATGNDQARANAALQNKLNDLEARLSAVTAKLDKASRPSPDARNIAGPRNPTPSQNTAR
jgi:hypothetical protein